MAHRKLTLQEFREDFSDAYNDYETATLIGQYLDAADSPALVAVAARYLEVHRVFEEALISARVRRE